MDIIKAFQKNEVGINITIKGTYEEPLFRASDIAAVLEMTNIRVSIKDFDNTEKVVSNAYTLGGDQEVTFLTEKGLYQVLFTSRKPIAKTFKNWVCEVIKEIRINGKYELEQQLKIKNDQLSTKDKEVENTLLNNFKDKSVVYLIKLNDNIIKFGHSQDIKRRLHEHRSDFGKDIILKTVFETVYNREFKQMIKFNFKKNLITIDNKHELIQLTEDFTYSQLLTEIEKLKNEVNSDLVPRLMKEIVELREKITPDITEIYNLKNQITELKLHMQNNSEISIELEISKLKEENSFLKLQLRKENYEKEKLELRKQELNLKYTQNMRSKNAHLQHRIENGIEQKYCPGILCREETGESGKWKELSQFGQALQNRDKLRGECKYCRNLSERSTFENLEKNLMTEEELKQSKIERSIKLRTKLVDGKKECIDCKELKELSQFKKAGGLYVTGEVKYRSDCTECLNKTRRLSKVNKA